MAVISVPRPARTFTPCPASHRRAPAGWSATLAVVAAFVLPPATAITAAQPRESRTPYPRFERLTVADGLSHNTVRDTLVDADGFLWLATDDGLNRSDGVATRVFRFDAASGRRNRMLSLTEAPAAAGLWVGTDHGVYRLPPGADRFEAVATGVEFVASLLRDSADRIWVGGLGQLVRVGDGHAESAVRCVADSPGPRDLVRDIVEGPDGTIWALFLHDESLRPIVAAVDPATLEAHCTRPPGQGLVWGLGIADGALWVGHHRAPLNGNHHGNRLGAFEPIEGLDPGVTLTALAAGPDRIWLGTPAGGFYWDAASRSAVPVEAATADAWLRNSINRIRIDPGGGAWLSTMSGVLHWDPRLPQFRHLELAEASTPGSQSGASVSAFAPVGERLWVGTFDAGLFDVDPDSGDASAVGAGWRRAGCSESIWSLALEERGHDNARLWAGTEFGLCSLDVGTQRVTRWPVVFPEPHEERVKRVLLPAATDADRSLWLLLNGAVARFDPESSRLRIVEPPRDLAEGFAPVDALMLGQDLWVGLSRGGLIRFGPAEPTLFRLRSVTGAILFASILDLHPAGDRLWLATSNGLLRFDPRNGSTTLALSSDALPSSVVYSVIDDASGALWLGTAAGLVGYEPGAGPRSVRRYGPAQGVLSMEFNRHASLAGDGWLFFGGNRGLTWIDPDSIVQDRVQPRLVLDGAELHAADAIRSVPQRSAGPLVVRPGEEVVVLHYTAPSLVNASGVMYRHRLAGFNQSWQHVGEARVARYTGIPPGRYTFEAQAGTGDGGWGPVARWPVKVRPTLLESRWLQGVVALLMGGVIAGGVLIRRRNKQEIERLRLGIASDLHDDIGSELSGIALAAVMGGRDPALSPMQREAMLRISEKARTMLEAVRHVVWSIDPIHDNTQSLVERMRAVAQDLLVASSWILETNLSTSSRRLDTLPRRSLFLAFKELLHNVARHAQASRVTISLEQRGALLELQVTDDGVGFDPARHAGDRPGGMGLRGLRRRALSAGGRFEVDSRVGGGTRVIFAVPTRALGSLTLAPRRPDGGAEA